MAIECTVCLKNNPDSATECLSCGAPLEVTAETPLTHASIYHLPPGTLLCQGKYQIEKTIGEGGFGITYKGSDRQKATTVAIKELWPEKAARQGTLVFWPNSISPKEKHYQLIKFQQEAAYLQKCDHPHIVKVYDYFTENDTAYIAMTFIKGKSLYKILKESEKLPEEQVKRYFRQIAAALAAVHAQRLLHRDIKPDNILIDESDRAVLIDFGATRDFIAGQTGDMTTIVSQGYAPLEQYSSKAKRFPATDIYALCASMYEVLTGELPTSATERAVSHPLIPPRQLRPDLSSLMEQVILTGLQMRVEDRFQTAEELVEALDGKLISPGLKRAQELVRQQKLAEAAQAYRNCLTNDPNNGQAAVELSLVQFYLNEEQAKIDAEQAIRLSPKDGRGYGILGLIYCRQGNWNEAVQKLEQSANLSPQEPWIQANLAWALGKTGNWQRGETVIQRALQLDNNCTFALGVQAWIAIHQEQWKSAIQSATKSIYLAKQASSKINQNLQEWVYPLRIIALIKATVQPSKDVDRCVNDFIRQLPNSGVSWAMKGWLEASRGNSSGAIADLTGASRQANFPGWALINLGILQEQQDLKNAISIYEIYVQKYQPNPFVYFRLGTLYGQLKQWKTAKSYLEKATKFNPDYAEAYHNLGWVLLNLKAVDESAFNFREMLTAYQRSLKLYTEQNLIKQAYSIQQAFQAAEINLF